MAADFRSAIVRRLPIFHVGKIREPGDRPEKSRWDVDSTGSCPRSAKLSASAGPITDGQFGTGSRHGAAGRETARRRDQRCWKGFRLAGLPCPKYPGKRVLPPWRKDRCLHWDPAGCEQRGLSRYGARSRNGTRDFETWGAAGFRNKLNPNGDGRTRRFAFGHGLRKTARDPGGVWRGRAIRRSHAVQPQPRIRSRPHRPHLYGAGRLRSAGKYRLLATDGTRELRATA